MDRERFFRAREKMLSGHERSGIGTLSEKTVHAVLKEYYGGGDESKELSVGDFVADVVCEEGIVEIQTRALYRLERKLKAFLPVCRVTVVHPIEAEKYIITLDPESGELISRRRSPKREKLWHGLAELYGLRSYLTHEGLTVRFPVITVEESRFPPTGKGRRRRATKLDRVPADMTDEIVLKTGADYAALLPEELSESFTSADLAALCRISADTARSCINILAAVGVLEESGRQGRRKLWQKTAEYTNR